eukprot:TRINITY_DN60815_c0_g1_i1.p1 TRINITY_DN60815_c0_g1~~TRINITY_DN60815_c0_g1_i1.p1  ORF type:complete len:347 (+),score=33.77 TRINITY_DN60815_c0_g1_i1:60-1043(+)
MAMDFHDLATGSDVYPWPELDGMLLKSISGVLLLLIILTWSSRPLAWKASALAVFIVGCIDTLWITNDGTSLFWGHMAVAILFCAPTVEMLHTEDGLVSLPSGYALCSSLVFGFLMSFEVKQAILWGISGSTLAHITIYFSGITFFASTAITKSSSFYQWRKIHDPFACIAMGVLIWKHVHDIRPVPVAVHTIQGQSFIALGLSTFACVLARGDSAELPHSFRLLRKLHGFVAFFNLFWVIAMSYLLYLGKLDNKEGTHYGLHEMLWTLHASAHGHHGPDEAVAVYACLTAWVSLYCQILCSMLEGRRAKAKYEEVPVESRCVDNEF